MTPVDTIAGSFVERTAEAFAARILPKTEWTHHAHLRVGLWHVLRYGPSQSIDLLRTRIRALNESHGVPNTETGGYHETITRFYVWQIERFLRDADRGRAVDSLAEELIRLYGDKDLAFRYWTKDRLMSSEARAGWIEPDLEALS
jgi:hypothetical protein